MIEKNKKEETFYVFKLVAIMKSDDPYDADYEENEASKTSFINSSRTTESNDNSRNYNENSRKTSYNDTKRGNLNDFELFTREKYERDMLSSIELRDLNNSFNTFSNRKTYSTGLLDLALLTSNFVQMKNIIISNKWTPLNVILIMFIIISVGLQLACGVVLIFAARNFDEFTNDNSRRYSIRINNSVTLLVLLISILNIFISVFTSI